MSSRFVLMAAESMASPASFSAAHHASICSLVGLVPGNVNLMSIWKPFGTTLQSLSSSILSRFLVSNCLLVCVFSRPWHSPGLFSQHWGFVLGGVRIGVGVGRGRVWFVGLLWDGALLHQGERVSPPLAVPLGCRFGALFAAGFLLV